MRKHVVVVVVGLCLTAGFALAQGSNTGGGGPAGVGDHDLTPDPEGGISILYAPSESDDAAYRAAIAAITGGTVDYFDASAGTPDLTLLNNYDCVYTWANFAYADNVGFGDNLADYVDGGGNVVLGAFTTFTSGNFLDGRIMDPGYSPVFSPSGGNWFFSSPYAGDGTTCIHDGVTAYECTFRDMLALQGSGIQDGSYDDGEIAHSYRPDFDVVHSNGSGAVQLGCTGDWARLVANSCNCSTGCVLTADIGDGPIRAGDTVGVDLGIQHNRLETVRKRFRIEVLDRRGRVIVSDATAPVTLRYGEAHDFVHNFQMPAGVRPGMYRLRVAIDGMQHGRSTAVRNFRVDR